MEIPKKHYLHEQHILVFNNATTHLKHAGGSLSASKMPKGPPANFFVEVNAMNDMGKAIYGPDRKIATQKIPMADGKFSDETEQPFYYPENYEHAGQFKRMAKILEERGYQGITNKKAQCGKKFTDCSEGSTTCCCCWMLYSKSDFKNVNSILEAEAKEQGF